MKKQEDFKMGELVEMSLDDFKELVKHNDLGYAMGCNNLLKMCFANVSTRVKVLLQKSAECKKRKDNVMANTFSDYAFRLVYSQKCIEDKLVFLKEYIYLHRLN